jgi:hypothetical protein
MASSPPQFRICSLLFFPFSTYFVGRETFMPPWFDWSLSSPNKSGNLLGKRGSRACYAARLGCWKVEKQSFRDYMGHITQQCSTTIAVLDFFWGKHLRLWLYTTLDVHLAQHFLQSWLSEDAGSMYLLSYRGAVMVGSILLEPFL